MVSGLAASIRSSDESSTFDLGHQDANSIRATIKEAFEEPFPVTKMIRITFIVGGGKLSRSKYDSKCGQVVTAALNNLGFVEDRGASCVNECAGCFKSQHDTGKNIFTVVVFPRIEVLVSTASSGGSHDEDDDNLIPTNSPGYKMAVAPLTTFKNLLSTYVPTYLEKKACQQTLDGLRELEQAIESKMMNGNPLDSAEQSFYDSACDLKEKHSYVQKEASKHVDDGRLTAGEKDYILELNENRIKALMSEKSSATTAERLKKALARKQQLQKISPVDSEQYPPPLRYEANIRALRKKVMPLCAIEDNAKGRLMTLAETRAVTEKEELETEIAQLEEASCGWFEDEESFTARVEASRKKFASQFGRSKRSGGGVSSGRARMTGSKGNEGVSKWILPGEKPKSRWGEVAAGGKKKAKGGAVFSAMMMDDSSSDEESDDDEVEVVTAPARPNLDEKSNVRAPKQKQVDDNSWEFVTNKRGKEAAASSRAKQVDDDPVTVQPTTSGEGKKKSKKKKKKKKNAHDRDEDESTEKRCLGVVHQGSTKKDEGSLNDDVPDANYSDMPPKKLVTTELNSTAAKVCDTPNKAGEQKLAPSDGPNIVHLSELNAGVMAEERKGEGQTREEEDAAGQKPTTSKPAGVTPQGQLEPSSHRASSHKIQIKGPGRYVFHRNKRQCDRVGSIRLNGIRCEFRA
mmetsp:Transcript_25195/g.59948  ORF Transcript_25195/g.59948 Transcript_25195/m.59948 type:complete len:688 (+) Transcript_25195:249-2312(+)